MSKKSVEERMFDAQLKTDDGVNETAVYQKIRNSRRRLEDDFDDSFPSNSSIQDQQALLDALSKIDELD